jgi:hypothetical protein
LPSTASLEERPGTTRPMRLSASFAMPHQNSADCVCWCLAGMRNSAKMR